MGRRASEFKLKEYKNFQIKGGTADKSDFKSCYINIGSHFVCNKEDHHRNLREFLWEIKQSVYRYTRDSIFKERFICVPMIADSFKDTGKSFNSFEFTFYLRKNVEVNEAVKSLNEIADKIEKELFSTNKRFNFYKTMQELKHELR